MDAWRGKVAIVTGASAGIGAALCKDLCKWNVIVVGMARRLENMGKLKDEILALNSSAKFHPIRCDLTKEEDIKSGFAEVIEKFGGIDILINNAGVISSQSILEDDSEDIVNKIIQTNVIAVVSCIKKAYKSMVARGTPGYIINVSSIVGHMVPNVALGKPISNVYPSSKYAITALNHVLRSELNYFKQNKIRISNISPGLVKTEIAEAAGVPSSRYPSTFPFLQAGDVSDAIIYMLSTPTRVQIQDIIIKPTGEMV